MASPSSTPSIDDRVLREVVQGTPDGLLISDDAGHILYVNSALCEITGYSDRELVGQFVEVLVPDGHQIDHVSHREQFARSPRTRPMGRGIRLSARRKDGTSVAVEISLSPVASPEGTLTLASVRDITERLEAADRLRSAGEMLAMASERERIARDLHDTVLQRLFGLGLELQALGMRASPEVGHRLEGAVDEIDRIIREIRTTVFTLGSAQREGSLGHEIGAVIAQAARVLGFTPRLVINGPVESMASPEIRIELVASLREALGNVARHAHASETLVELLATDELLELSVRDNGVGLPESFQMSAGNGLRNLAARAELLDGTCRIGRATGGGTEMHWHVPLSR